MTSAAPFLGLGAMIDTDRWATHSVADDRWLRVGFGTLGIIVSNFLNEWRVALAPDGFPESLGTSGATSDLPDNLKWERWTHETGDARLHFRPEFPAMPVVARPYHLLHFLPNSQAELFIGVAACIGIFGECKGEMTRLQSVPSAVLSKTWHGTPLAGRLGYASRTFARRTFEEEEWPPMEIVCPISIINQGPTTLTFERLYLETDHLAVFEKDGRLWSNAARIRVLDEDNSFSNVTYAKRPTAPHDDAREVTPPREGRTRRSTVHSAFAKVLDHFNPLSDVS